MPDTSPNKQRIRELEAQRDLLLGAVVTLAEDIAVAFNRFEAATACIGDELKRERQRDPKPNGRVKHG